MKTFTRKEILDRLNDKIRNNRPIIMSGAGLGIIAEISDYAGIDMIFAYCTGPFRMGGFVSCMGSMPYSNCVDESLNLARILTVVKNTPVAAGVDAGNPWYPLEYVVPHMIDLGFSAITNVPSVGRLKDQIIRPQLDDGDMGFSRELELVRYCRKHDIFTAFYAYTPEMVTALVAEGVDAIGLHVGGTSGGLVGFSNVPSMQEACDKTQMMYELAKKENPEVITFSHGGPFEGPPQIAECFRNTDVDGFIGASSLERIPVEKAVMAATREFLDVRTR